MSSAIRILTAAAVAALLAGTAPVLGAGDGGNSLAKQRESAADAAADAYVEARKLVEAGDYAEAIDALEELLDDQPDNADVLNYLGYSHRKLGRTDAALDYYLAALNSEPEHLGANEYLGELYLEMGELAKAEERLSVLQRACSGCMEEDELAEKIAAVKAD